MLDPSARRARQRREEIWALRDVSFSVSEGEAIGLIGPNGAGKSTLLKILSRITEPTTGSVRLRGRVASLLEVGTGFHPELTGRENIFLNGTILGMTRAEIRQRFDEIVAFAEIERFLDTPVKRYSSGMYVRLAFAVAAHLTPEILLVDEVLAVGDYEFQRRCLGRMHDVTRSGRTVVFISHNMAAIEELCERAVLLRKGRVESIGQTVDVVSRYLQGSSGPATNDLLDADHEGTGSAVFSSYELRSGSGEPIDRLRAGEPFRIRLHFHVERTIVSPTIGFAWLNERAERVFMTNSVEGGVRIERLLPGAYRVDCSIDQPNLLPGRYRLEIWITDVPNVSFADYLHLVGDIELLPTERWSRPMHLQAQAGKGLVYLSSQWADPMRVER